MSESPKKEIGRLYGFDRDLAELQARIAVLEGLLAERIGPKPWCPKCNDPVAAHHSILGCQTKMPFYLNGRLAHHDVCGCGRPKRGDAL